MHLGDAGRRHLLIDQNEEGPRIAEAFDKSNGRYQRPTTSF